jgi:hypothetical protein
MTARKGRRAKMSPAAIQDMVCKSNTDRIAGRRMGFDVMESPKYSIVSIKEVTQFFVL